MSVVFLLPGQHCVMGFATSLAYEVAYLIKDGHDVAVKARYSADIYNCRNRLIEDPESDGDIDPVVEDADWVVMIDSDSVWDPGAVQALIAHGEDVGAGMICGAVPITTTYISAGVYRQTDEGPVMSFVRTDMLSSILEPMPIEHSTLAFTAIRPEVFEELGWPWFRPTMGMMGDREIVMTEDTGFSARCQDIGVPMYLAPSVRVTHRKVMDIKP